MTERAAWAAPDHAATLRRDLLAMMVSELVSVLIRASTGERWAATRYAVDEWHVAHRDGRSRRGGLEDVVKFVDGG